MNKVVLVTGASRGIGRAIASEFAKERYDVVINYVAHQEEASQLKRELEAKYQIKALTIQSDVTQEKEVEAMIKEIMDTYGRIDVLVNNAGIAIDKEFKDRTVADWEKTLNTNLIGPFLVSKYVGNIMMENRGGVKSLIFLVRTGLMPFFPLVLTMMRLRQALLI